MATGLLDIENAIGAIGHSASSSPVILGSLVLTGIEVPDRLQVGGRQMLVVHRLPGGGKIIDALGNDPGRLELRGRFFGPDAQSRAQEIERLRISGEQVSFSAAGLSLQVWIVQFVYTYEAKGALCSYILTLERPAEGEQNGESTTSLSEFLGEDTSSALQGLSDTVSELSTGIFTAAGQVGTIIGQVTPLATMIGAGSAFAGVSNALEVVNGVAQSGSNLANTPSALSGISNSLGIAKAGLNSIIDQSSLNVDNIHITNSQSFLAVSGNAALLSAAVDSEGLVGRTQAVLEGAKSI
ncbi:hypothetical protein JK193_09735 [Gluconobacter wancherniae]|nr:hypothetical protein [Gluconobacter wancherniae]